MMKALSGRSIEKGARKTSSKETSDAMVKVGSSSRNAKGRWSMSKGKSSPRPTKDPPNEAPCKTQVGQRLKSATLNHPQQSGRSQDIVHISRDFDRLRKNLREFAMIARKYQTAMAELDQVRMELYHTSTTLSSETHLSEMVQAQSGDLPNILRTEMSKRADRHVKNYQEMVVDYATEWECVASKMVQEGVEHTHRLHKVVQHYEEKVSKLRKQIQEKESNDKTPPASLTEKLRRNEEKLSKAWQDYDRAGTRTANLLEEATKMGWKDFHPLVQAMIVFEQEHGRDEQSLLGYIDSIQDTLVSVFARLEDATSPVVDTLQEDHVVEPTERTEIHIDSSEEDEEIPGVNQETPAVKDDYSSGRIMECDLGAES